MAANKTIGGINVAITATTSQFAKSITSAQRMTKGFTKTLGGLVFNLKTLGAALAVGGVAKLVSDQYEAIGTMKDLADKTGINVEKIAGLELIAREAGVSMSVMEKALVKLNTEMGMQGDVALRSWIEKTSKLTTAQERLAAATAMFGSRGSDMVRLVAGGVAAFDEAQKAAEMSGMAISAATAMGVDRALESYERLKDNVTGIFRTMAAESWPYLQALVDATNNFIASSGGGKGVGTFVVDVLVEMAKQVVDGINNMVANVVSLTASAMHAFHDWRSSSAAQLGGFGYASDDAKAEGYNNALKMGSYAMELGQNKPSDRIQALVDSAKQIAAQAAASAGTTGPGMLDSLLSSVKSAGMGAVQSWQGAGMGLVNMIGGQLQNMSMAAGRYSPQRATGKRPALAFAESGSVESYRQQAAIRRGNEDVGKKQLRVQEKMLEAIKDLGTGNGLQPANFGF